MRVRVPVDLEPILGSQGVRQEYSVLGSLVHYKIFRHTPRKILHSHFTFWRFAINEPVGNVTERYVFGSH